VVRSSLGVLAHVLQDLHHDGIPEDGLDFGVLHCLGRAFFVVALFIVLNKKKQDILLHIDTNKNYKKISKKELDRLERDEMKEMVEK
jgi:hypothetical protein